MNILLANLALFASVTFLVYWLYRPPVKCVQPAAPLTLQCCVGNVKVGNTYTWMSDWQVLILAETGGGLWFARMPGDRVSAVSPFDLNY